MKSLEKKLLFVIVFLILAALFLIFFRNKFFSKKDSVSTQVVRSNTIVKEDGSVVKTKSLYGEVIAWQPQWKILKVAIKGGETKDFQIDPTVTKVMIPVAKRNSSDDQLHLVKKAEGKHWETAFCLTDNVSLVINSSTSNVELVMNDGQRMCGYQGAWE